MREKLKMSSRPTSVRIILIVSSIIIILLTGILAFFARSYLMKYANSVAQTTAESKDTQTSLENLSRAKKDLASEQDAVVKANRIVAESKQYEYQNQIINDLNAYATRSNITISGFMFEALAAPTGSGAAAPKSATVAGLKTAQVTISLEGSIAYQDFLNFLALVENNATRMQLQGVDISPATAEAEPGEPVPPVGTAPDLISVRSLTIGVYIR